MRTFAAFVVIALLALSAQAQVLTPAQTLGKGNDSLFFSENHLFVDDLRLNIAYAGYMRGITENFDVYLYAGETHVMKRKYSWFVDRDQAWVGVGGNLTLFRFKGFAVSSFHVVSTGLYNRDLSSTVLWNAAYVVSRNVSDSVSLWSGLNLLMPIGRVQQGLFTPPEAEWNIPIGGSWVINHRFSIAGEVDVGHVTAVGVGLSVVP